MKPDKRKYDPRREIPLVIFNWLALLWFLLLISIDGLRDIAPSIVTYIIIAFMIISFGMFAVLCFKGSRARFYFNSRTDNFGWIVRTGKKIKNVARKLAVNYPTLVKRITLKGTDYRVTITKKYRYHQNPIDIEEIE